MSDNAAMDLRTWIVAEHASVGDRIRDGVVERVPVPLWTEHADAGGSCLAQLFAHVSLHADLALQAVVRGVPPLIDTWRDRLGLGDLAPHQGLPESEDPELVARVSVPDLIRYAEAVHAETAGWLAATDLAGLDTVPDASGRLRDIGRVTVDAVPWLHRMWTDKPVSWFVQWECTGHVLNHLGEMVSVRNRLGLSPF